MGRRRPSTRWSATLPVERQDLVVACRDGRIVAVEPAIGRGREDPKLPAR
jgi:hypothetical protein